MLSSQWKVAGASVTGFAHEADGTVCQDAHAIATTRNGWFVAVLSDGAGSARYSDASARLISHALVAQLANRLDQDNGNGLDETLLRDWIGRGVEEVRHQLRTSTLGTEHDLHDLHATLLGVAAGPNWGLFFHIGDGVGCATTMNDLATSIISSPENGEYANETYFVTQDDWREHLRLTFFDSKYDLIALMSDGAMPFAMATGQLMVFQPFFEPLSRYLAEHTREDGERAIAAILAKDEVRRITGDDKTLVWALRDCAEA